MSSENTATSIAAHASDASFAADVLQSAAPVLLDWWAPWCAPCHAIAPVLEEVVRAWPGGQLRLVKVNVADNPQTPAKYGLRGIPTLMLFRGGELLGTRVGTLDKGELQAWLGQLLGQDAA